MAPCDPRTEAFRRAAADADWPRAARLRASSSCSLLLADEAAGPRRPGVLALLDHPALLSALCLAAMREDFAAFDFLTGHFARVSAADRAAQKAMCRDFLPPGRFDFAVSFAAFFGGAPAPPAANPTPWGETLRVSAPPDR